MKMLHDHPRPPGQVLFSRVLPALLCGLLAVCTGCKKDELARDTDFFIKYYGGPELDGGKDILQTSDGGYLLLGTRATGSTTETEIALIRVDTAGNVISERTLGTGKAGQLFSLANGGIVAVGSVIDGSGNYDMLVTGLDAEGQTQWVRQIGAIGRNEEGYAGIERQDGGLVIVGLVEDASGFLDAKVILANAVGTVEIEYEYGFPDQDERAVGVVEVDSSVFLVCGDGDGNTTGKDLFALSIISPQQSIDQVWRWQIPSDQSCVGLSQLSSGNYLVLGYEVTGSNHQLVQAEWDPISLDSLRPDQDYTYGTVSDLVPTRLCVATGLGIYVAGYTAGNDFAVALLDSSGILQGQATYPGADVEQAYGVTATADNGLALFGTLIRSGTAMMMLVKDNATTFE